MCSSLPMNQPKSDFDLRVLQRMGLISEFEIGNRGIVQEEQASILFFCRISPTDFGVMLYAAAHNRLKWWANLGLQESFGKFIDVEPLEVYGRTLEELLERTP